MGARKASIQLPAILGKPLSVVHMPGQDSESDMEPEMTLRVKWSHKFEFLLSLIAFTTGLGNIWRFPFLCYKHGGASFMLVYLFLQMTVGFPLSFMELVLGQFSGKGPVNIWDFNPIARGIGISMCMTSYFIVIYYNALMSIIMFYMFSSLQESLPWSFCTPDMNNCLDWSKNATAGLLCTVTSKQDSNCTCTEDPAIDNALSFKCIPQFRRPSEVYFYDNVVKRASSLLNVSDLGVPTWQLALCLLLNWIIVIACVIKGVRSSGKVMHFTAICPYVLLVILLVRGVLEKGAGDGISFLLVPRWHHLRSLGLWQDAAAQVFYSLGLGMGGLITLSSHQHFYNNLLGDCLIMNIVDVLTSVLCSVVVFVTLGHLARQPGRSFHDIADKSSRFGLAFNVYPEAVTHLPAPQIWSFIFFFMLFVIAIDSQFVLVETCVGFLEDNIRVVRKNSMKTRIAVGVVSFLLGLPCLTPGGYYLIKVLDKYGGALPLVFLCACEAICTMWIYGLRRFLKDVKYMLGRKPPCWPVWYFTLGGWSQLVLIVMTVDEWFFGYLCDRSKYASGDDYTDGLIAVAWLTYTFLLLPIPIWACLYARAVYDDTVFVNRKEFLKKLLEPLPRWGPADGTHRLAARRTCNVLRDIISMSAQTTDVPESAGSTDTSEHQDHLQEANVGDFSSEMKKLPAAVFDRARRKLSCEKRMSIGPGGSHRVSASVDPPDTQSVSKESEQADSVLDDA